MKVNWETFPQYMDSLSQMPLGINLGHLLPTAPAVAYVMGGFDEAKKQFPGEREMFQLKRMLHEAMDAGAYVIAADRGAIGEMLADGGGAALPSDRLIEHAIREIKSFCADRSALADAQHQSVLAFRRIRTAASAALEA